MKIETHDDLDSTVDIKEEQAIKIESNPSLKEIQGQRTNCPICDKAFVKIQRHMRDIRSSRWKFTVCPHQLQQRFFPLD